MKPDIKGHSGRNRLGLVLNVAFQKLPFSGVLCLKAYITHKNGIMVCRCRPKLRMTGV